MSVYPKPIPRQALRHAQLQFQVTMLSHRSPCCVLPLLCESLRSVPRLRRFLEVPKEGCLSSSCVCAFDLPHCLLLPFSIWWCVCVCPCTNFSLSLGQLPRAVLWRFRLEGAAMSAPTEQVAPGKGKELASPKCSTF